MNLPKDKPLVLFDGVCNFCNGTVRFINRYDKKNKFLFASLQSESAGNVLRGFGKDSFQKNVDTIVLIYNGKLFIKSDAVIEIAGLLGGIFSLSYPFKFIPRFIRDFFYAAFARYRYRIFGKRETCMIPSQGERNKFFM